MGNVHLIQHLCPQRHCITAAPYLASEQTSHEVIARLKEMEAKLGLNPWCGICGSTQLHFEDRATIFETLEEAMPALESTEAANLAAMRLFGEGFKGN